MCPIRLGRAALFAASVLLAIVLLHLAYPSTQLVLAQAPTPDSFEENDTLTDAAGIANTFTRSNLTISPADDPDYWRVLAVPGPLSIEVYGAPGLDITLTLYDSNGLPVASVNDPTSADASIDHFVESQRYYAIAVESDTGREGWYTLDVQNQTPTATTTPTLAPTATLKPTNTPTPTATPVDTPTPTATPDVGGPPDIAEPNYDFAHAYRIAAGDVLTGLNFNPGGWSGGADNDFFVMPVRAGITYTCETRDLGPGVDTNLIVYASASFEDMLGGNDDIDTQSGQINSRLTFVSPLEGDLYILIGYKYPETAGLAYPGGATYTLTCFAAQPTPTNAPINPSGGMPSATDDAAATSVFFTEISRPDSIPTPTPMAVETVNVTVIVGYDENANHTIDLAEGVAGLSVRLLDPATNRELAHGVTNVSGVARLAAPTNRMARVAIPFLSDARDFRPGPAQIWEIVLPAGTQPGLIP